MKSTRFSDANDDGAAFLRTLDAARRATIFRAVAATAARWFVVAAALGVFAALGRWLDVDFAVRWGVWGAGVVGTGVVAAIRRRRRFPTSFRFARRLERRLERRDGLLTAAVEFAQDGAPRGELRAETIRRAARSFEAAWRELGPNERFSVVWNAPPNVGRTARRDVFCGVALTALAFGVGGPDAVPVAVPDVGGASERVVATSERRESAPDADVDVAIAVPNAVSDDGAAATAALVDDLTRALGVAENFARDLRRRAESERSEPPPSGESRAAVDRALLQTGREIESLVDAPDKGLAARLARLEEASRSASPRRFDAELTAVRARELRDYLSNDAVFRTTGRLDAAARGATRPERIRTFDDAADVAERFAETLRRERIVWSILLASENFETRRRALTAASGALFDAAKTALARVPGRTALELADVAPSPRVVEEAARLQALLNDAASDCDALRARTSRADAAEFRAFAERVARRIEAPELALDDADVAAALRASLAEKTAVCERVAADAADGRFGAAAELVEKTLLASDFSVAPLLRTDDSDKSDGADESLDAAASAVGLTFGFGGARECGDDVETGPQTSARTVAEAFGRRAAPPNAARSENGGVESAADAESVAAERDANLGPNSETNFAAKFDAFAKTDAVGGDSPDATFQGGFSPRDASAPSVAAPFDAFWNELPDAERARLQEALETSPPPEFAEKIRLYRRRLFAAPSN